MSLALSVGSPMAGPGRTLRRCDDCRRPTWAPNAEADALWVVCDGCYASAQSEAKAVEAELAARGLA
jgi:hypothetical protein